MKSVIFLIVVLIPAMLFAQEVAPLVVESPVVQAVANSKGGFIGGVMDFYN